VDRSTSPQQVAVTLVGVLGGLALLLAAIGLYGVMSYAVSQSTRELGLRMALGAGASNLLRLVMKRGLALTAGGVALGAAVALGLTRLLGNLLYNVSPRDPLAFGSAFLVMTIAALTACFLPAWRATGPIRCRRCASDAVHLKSGDTKRFCFGEAGLRGSPPGDSDTEATAARRPVHATGSAAMAAYS
jgi:predicted lysophospholipase L1 biosynthesis ABC-type transport system permease subunit